MNYNRNPTGVGGVEPGEIRNPTGRPKSHSRVQLWFMRHALECGEIILGIARNGEGTKAESIRLAACRELLDRGLGKAPQAIDLAVDLTLGKRLDEMSPEELVEFKAKYIALTSAAPAAIDHVLEHEKSVEQAELMLDDDIGRES